MEGERRKVLTVSPPLSRTFQFLLVRYCRCVVRARVIIFWNSLHKRFSSIMGFEGNAIWTGVLRVSGWFVGSRCRVGRWSSCVTESHESRSGTPNANLELPFSTFIATASDYIPYEYRGNYSRRPSICNNNSAWMCFNTYFHFLP